MRRSLSIFAALALMVGAMFVAPLTVEATSNGPCVDTNFDSDTNEQVGLSTVNGVRAYIDPSAHASLCTTGNPYSDEWVAISVGVQSTSSTLNCNGGCGLLTAGWINCNDANPFHTFCDVFGNSTHFFWEGTKCGDVNTDQFGSLGAADRNSHRITILYYTSANEWRIYVDGVLKKSVIASGDFNCLSRNEQDGVDGSYDFYKNDRGNGYGNSNADASTITTLERASGATWVTVDGGPYCDAIGWSGSPGTDSCLTQDSPEGIRAWTTY